MLGHPADEVVGIGRPDPRSRPRRARGAWRRSSALPSGSRRCWQDAREGGASASGTLVRRDGTRVPAARMIAPILERDGRRHRVRRPLPRRERAGGATRTSRPPSRACRPPWSGPAPRSWSSRRWRARPRPSSVAPSRRREPLRAATRPSRSASWQRDGVRSLPLGAHDPLDGTIGHGARARSAPAASRIDDVSPSTRRRDRTRVGRPIDVRGGGRVPAARGRAAVGRPAPRVVAAPGSSAPTTRCACAASPGSTEIAITNAEARERIVGDTIAGIFRSDLDVDATIDLVVAAARRALAGGPGHLLRHRRGRRTVVVGAHHRDRPAAPGVPARRDRHDAVADAGVAAASPSTRARR